MVKQNGLHVLVVEDDKDTAASLAMLLDAEGHEVKVAQDGFAALQVVQDDRVDVGLIDLGLPGMNGCQVARHLKSRPAEKRPFIIGITGLDQESVRDRFGHGVIDLFFAKPADPEQLLAILRRFQSILTPET